MRFALLLAHFCYKPSFGAAHHCQDKQRETKPSYRTSRRLQCCIGIEECRCSLLKGFGNLRCDRFNLFVDRLRTTKYTVYVVGRVRIGYCALRCA